ncbi:MAG: hypothetical protein EA374_06740 [Acholeplasmatales bacterium]|nr:MAG: hypothetical protein EA374_06740 [Acholeplasmatales bacterium]
MKKLFTPYSYRLANLLHVLALISVLLFIPAGIAIGVIDYKLVPIENEFGQVVGTTFAFNTAAMLDIWLYGLISAVTFALSAFLAQKVYVDPKLNQVSDAEDPNHVL